MMRARLLVAGGTATCSTDPLPPLAIPTTAAGLAGCRRPACSPRIVAQIGAVIGREFSYELIAAVSALEPMDLDAELERCRSVSSPPARYWLRLGLRLQGRAVKDSALRQLLKGRQRQLHANTSPRCCRALPTMPTAT